MSKAELLTSQIQMAHMFLDGTCADIDQAQADNVPGGTAHPIGASLAHTALAEDVILNLMVRGSQPLALGEWKDKSGISEPEPGDRTAENLLAWANRVKVDLPQFQPYAKAVLANTLEWVGSLSDEDLEREVSVPGFPTQSVAGWITLAAIVHPSNHCGEVSALKGIQGAKGYPF
jgi:hypothetical protein